MTEHKIEAESLKKEVEKLLAENKMLNEEVGIEKAKSNRFLSQITSVQEYNSELENEVHEGVEYIDELEGMMRDLEERQVPVVEEESVRMEPSRNMPMMMKDSELELEQKAQLLSAAQSKNQMYQAYNL